MRHNPARLAAGDPCGKELIAALLGDCQTHGLDVDSFYHHPAYGWVFFELLKCDSVSPSESDVNRFAHLNWNKFAGLWDLTLAVRRGGEPAELMLIYYQKTPGGWGEFKVQCVTGLDYERKLVRRDESPELTTFAEVRQWFLEINGA
jgi:hypothetical protein